MKTKTAVKKAKPQRPKDFASGEYRRLYGHLSMKSSILNIPKRTQSLKYAFMDFGSEKTLNRILKECQSDLIAKNKALDNVLDEINNNLKRKKLLGRSVEFPDPKNLYKWRGVRSKQLDEALAAKDVALDSVRQIKRDIKRAKANKAKLIKTQKKKKPRRILGIVNLQGGVPVKADRMKVVMKKGVPIIDECEYYGGMKLEDYMQNVVHPHKKEQSKRLKRKNSRLETAIENNSFPQL